MNSKAIKTSVVAVLGAALAIASLSASATQSPARRVMQLGTIKVTAADTEEARAARRSATVDLGVIRVTPADAAGASYASIIAHSGTLSLGTVKVTPRDAKPALLGEMLAVTHHLAQKTAYAVVTALVFARTWG